MSPNPRIEIKIEIDFAAVLWAVLAILSLYH